MKEVSPSTASSVLPRNSVDGKTSSSQNLISEYLTSCLGFLFFLSNRTWRGELRDCNFPTTFFALTPTITSRSLCKHLFSHILSLKKANTSGSGSAISQKRLHCKMSVFLVFLSFLSAGTLVTTYWSHCILQFLPTCAASRRCKQYNILCVSLQCLKGRLFIASNAMPPHTCFWWHFVAKILPSRFLHGDLFEWRRFSFFCWLIEVVDFQGAAILSSVCRSLLSFKAKSGTRHEHSPPRTILRSTPNLSIGS